MLRTASFAKCPGRPAESPANGRGPKHALAFHPAFNGPAAFQREHRSRWLSDDTLTTDTIRHMLENVRDDVDSEPVRNTAAEIRASVPGDPKALACAVHAWMRAHVRYVEDAELAAGLTDSPEDVEVLIRPADLFSMQEPQGDCDDFAQGIAALLLALDIPAAFKTAKCNPVSKKVWSHVYTVAQLPDGPLVLDGSHGPEPGWEVTPIFESRLWPVNPMKTATLPRTVNVGALRGAARSIAIANPYGIVRVSLRGIGDAESDAGDESGSGIDWGSIIGGAETSAASILGKRYGVPQLNPGQLIRGPNGQLMYQGFPGQALPNGLNIPGLTGSSTGSMTSILLLAVVGVVLVIAMKGKG